ncbi:glycosyltransferase [Sulfurimonas sp. SWIR-19]|uniref:glycosyltransferase n=1 Tax=Sulfurimonas sp. SWIR-19 TaxID=2878390 RepID=UPI001CF44A72|nr:glycosyltransferase [Sulfurimonas sp. SWIR-19]UCN01136.1 glycosyltransferase [Sulfurimonas sp. SWIR-19]
MKNISILIYSLASGGAERQVSILLAELIEKYNITLFLMNDFIFYDIPKDVKVVLLENSSPTESAVMKLLKLPFLGWKYKKYLQDNNIDISLSFMNRPNYINAISKIFGSGIKVILSERAMPSLQHKNGLQGKINKFLIKYLYNSADFVVTNSKGNQYDLKLNFRIQNSKVIYNAVSLTECSMCANNKFIFITVGRLDRGKNHKLLIESWKQLNINAELWLIGEGPLRKDLEKIANKNIKFLGKQKDVNKFLAQAHCFVFSSNYEGFPNVLLEALACGLPIVSTDCKSGPREILAPKSDFSQQTESIEIAEYGILTKLESVQYLKQAMQIIYKDEKLRKFFGEKAKTRAKDFDIKHIVNQWKMVINS